MRWAALALAFIAGLMIARAYQTAVMVRYMVAAAACHEQLASINGAMKDFFVEVIRD